MDPISTITLALVAGAAASAKDAATHVVKDGYTGLRTLIVRKFGGKGDVQNAVEQAEKRPDSEARQAVLREELQAANADQDEEVLTKARALLELLKQCGALDDTNYSAINTDSGAIARRPVAVTAGSGGVAIGGDLSGDIVTGGSIDGDLVKGDSLLGYAIGQQINTAQQLNTAMMGAFFNIIAADLRNKAVRSSLSPEGQQIARLLDDYFDEKDLYDIVLQLKLDWNDSKDTSQFDQVSSLVAQCERRNMTPELKAVMRLARPQLRPQLK